MLRFVGRAPGDSSEGKPLVCAVHPAAVFGGDEARLVVDMKEPHAVCVNPRGIGAFSVRAPTNLLVHTELSAMLLYSRTSEIRAILWMPR